MPRKKRSTSTVGKDVKNISNGDSKEFKAKKEIEYNLGSVKNEDSKEYSIKVSGGTKYVGPYGEVFIPDEENNDIVWYGMEEGYPEEKDDIVFLSYNYNVNIEEDERKSFMPQGDEEEDGNMDVEGDENEKNVRKNKLSKTLKNDSNQGENDEVQDKETNKKKGLIKIEDGFPSDYSNLKKKKASSRIDNLKKSLKNPTKVKITNLTSNEKISILNKGIKKKNPKTIDKLEKNMENENSAYLDSNHSLVSAIDKIFLCEKCEKPFGSKTGLSQHTKTIHEGVRYSCDQCDGKHFGTKMGLYHHTKTIHEEVSYSCDQCDWKGRQPYLLKQHIQSVHEGVRYSCDHCNYKATDKSNLKRHVLKCQIPKPYQCSVCKKGFKTKYYVEVHNTAEHDRIRYNCSECDHKAIHRSALKFHVESVHEGIRYNCEQCNHNFTLKSNLSTHVKICKNNI